MPVLVRWPAVVKPGAETKALSLNVDFAPTFLEAAGLPLPAALPGRSPLPLLRGGTPTGWRGAGHYRLHPDEYPAERDLYSVRVRGAKILVVQRLR